MRKEIVMLVTLPKLIDASDKSVSERRISWPIFKSDN